MSQNQIVGLEVAEQNSTREEHKKSRKSHVAASALASALAASLATQAQAQDAQPTVTSTNQLANGDLQLVLSDGRTVVVNAADYQIVDGQIVLSQSVVADLNLAGAETVAAEGGVGSLPAILGGVVALGAAGGGGGGGGSGGGALAFSSGTTASAVENQTAAYDADVRNSNGDLITFSLSGEDAALFEIDDRRGVLTFIAEPDFETPGDTDGDNVYDVVITATVGDQTISQNVAITVTNEPSEPVDLNTLTPPQGFVVQRADVLNGATGNAVSSAGDVNGDGFDDIIVGAYRSADGGSASGRAYVVYGDATGADVNLDALTSAQGFFIQGEESGDFAGNSVSSAGDVNGDGFDDVIVGAARADNGGRAYVIYGGETVTDIDLSTLTSDQGFIIQGDQRGDRLGVSVSSAGDINGDGFEDLIIGAYYSDAAGTNAGQAYVIYGGSSGANINLGDLQPAQGFVIQGDAEYDRAGISVSSAGDVNGDGFDDLIIGADRGDDGGSAAGEAYVIYGGATVGADIDLSTLTPEQGYIIQGDVEGDRAGVSVSTAGDVNGDGFDDLIVGAFGGDAGGGNSGQAYVIYGGATVSANIDLSTLTPEQGFIIQGEPGASAGIAVSSAGDVNGDGFDDLILSAPFGNAPERPSGEAFVIYGSAEGTDVDLSALSPTQGFIIRGINVNLVQDTAVSSAGDVNGDGFDDLIVGEPIGGGGEAFVIYGGATETESTEAVSQTGTVAADNFTGNAGADSFSNIGTDDVVRGGAGDDVITITSLDFADVDGGHGTDSLILDGAGLNLDLTGARTDVENFELIDLTGTGDNTLTLDRLSLLDLSEDTAGGITTFTVRGDAGDSVILSDLGDWTSSGQRDVDGETFDVFTNGAAELLVDDAVSVISIAV